MANHVHVLLLPRIPPSRLLKSLKGYTAYQANRLLGRTGEPFWQRESYDHWVRNQEEWQRIAAYIENNPVKAGVVSQAEEDRWASAHATWRAKLDPPSVGRSADVARKSACATDTVRDPSSLGPVPSVRICRGSGSFHTPSGTVEPQGGRLRIGPQECDPALPYSGFFDYQI